MATDRGKAEGLKRGVPRGRTDGQTEIMKLVFAFRNFMFAPEKKWGISLDFCLTVHHKLGKVIQMNELDATMIY